MRRILLASFATIALLLAGMPTSADAASSGWKIYSYNAGGALSSKSAPGDASSVARFEFLSTADDALLATKQPGGPHAALNRKTITATFVIEGAGTFEYYNQPDACGAPANTRLYFSTNGPFAYTNFWWSNPASTVLTSPGGGTVTANVEPAEWSDWNGKFSTEDAATTAAFEAAAADPDLVGLSFGGGCFFQNGVGVTLGSATFRLISFKID